MCVRGRTAPIGLTRVLLVLLSATPSIIVHEPFYESPVFHSHADKRGPNAISRTGLRRRGHPLHLNVRRKGGACEREAQAAPCTGTQHARRLQQHTCGADVDHTHTHVGGEVSELTADLMPWRPSPLFHPSTHSSQPKTRAGYPRARTNSPTSGCKRVAMLGQTFVYHGNAL